MAGYPKPVDVELTIISAKDLKNVNWRYGDLRTYAVAWVDPARKVSTQVDLEGDTKPLWNQKLTIPVTESLQGAELTIDIVHEKASELTKPLVGTARIAVAEILEEVGFDQRQERTLKLKRPSGRPQGKLEIAVCLREKQWPEPQYGYSQYRQPYGTRDYPPQGYPPNYAPYPSQQYPYGNAPAPTGYPNSNPTGYPNSNPYGGSYAQPVQNPYGGPSPYYEQGSSGYGSATAYKQPEKAKSSKFGVGTGLAVGAVAGVLGGLALVEGVDYVEDKIADDAADKVEDDEGGYDDYDGGDDY